MKNKRFYTILFMVFLFTGCSSSVDYTRHTPPDHTSGGKPKHAPDKSKSYVINGKTYTPLKGSKGFAQKGVASWYGEKFHGRKTANGEIYNMYAMTAAHKTLPLGTWVKVRNLLNNRSITVRVNDRGPFVDGRIIDLSYTGAEKIGIVDKGTAPVKIVALGRAEKPSGGGVPDKFEPVDYWSGEFSVQVGAFKVKSNAVDLKAKLSQRYDNVHITTHEDYRGTFYRVRIGRYSDLKKAILLSKKLINIGARHAFPVAE